MDTSLSHESATGQVSPFSHILVAIDGSDASLRAASVAVRIAAMHALPVVALYVIDEASLKQVRAVSRDSANELGGRLESKGRRYLEYVTSIAGRYGVTCSTALRRGIPYAQIVETARDRNIDLVVLGVSPTLGRPAQGGRRVLAGSTADRVIAEVSCSVLIVK